MREEFLERAQRNKNKTLLEENISVRYIRGSFTRKFLDGKICKEKKG